MTITVESVISRYIKLRDQKAAIEAKVEELSKVSAPVAQKMYAEQGQPADGATQKAEPEAKHDDVVDAEFEEVKENK